MVIVMDFVLVDAALISVIDAVSDGLWTKLSSDVAEKVKCNRCAFQSS